MKISPVCIFLLFWVVPCNLFCQPPKPNYFEQNYLFQERLARGLVFDILQDKQGFLWFATEYGLIRYDGSTLKTYQNEPDNPFSLAGNVITCLAEDAKGNLWVGTMNSGLHYFDRKADQFIQYRIEAGDTQNFTSNKINDVLVRRNGAIWVATEGSGAQLFDKTIGQFNSIQYSNFKKVNTNALLEDQQEQLWLGDFFGLSQWDQNKKVFNFLANIEGVDAKGAVLKTLAKDNSDNIWAGFRNGGLVSFTLKSDGFKRIETRPDWPKNKRDNHIWDIHVDKGQHLWVGTDSSLLYLESVNDTAEFALSRYTLTQERRYLSICKSTDGVMWVGTNDGVLVLVPRHKPFQLMTPLKTGEQPAKTKRGVTAMTRRSDDQFWVGTIRGLFQCDIKDPRLHRDYLEQHPSFAQFENENISSIYHDTKNQLWFGIIDGFNRGFSLFRYDLSQKILLDFSNRDSLFSSFATLSITEDKNGHIWFGNGSGLLRYRPNEDSVQRLGDFPEQQVRLNRKNINQVLANNQEEVWIGTNDAGLIRYNLSTAIALLMA